MRGERHLLAVPPPLAWSPRAISVDHHPAARMAEDARSFHELARCRFPAGGETRIEKLVGGWQMVPHGDPVDGAESRRVEYEHGILVDADLDFVRVLVLGDDVGESPSRTLLHRESEHLFQCAEIRQCGQIYGAHAFNIDPSANPDCVTGHISRIARRCRGGTLETRTSGTLAHIPANRNELAVLRREENH